MPEPDTRIVTIADRPDLADVVTGWLWHEFWRQDGHSLADTRRAVAASAVRSGVPQCFVLLVRGQPVGTASLTAEDLDERPDLTPWLAGVYIVPEARGQGYVRHLLAAFETACRTAAIKTAWLYTNTAEPIYLRAGWRVVEAIQRPGKPAVTLMRRDVPDERAGSSQGGSRNASPSRGQGG